MKKLSLCLMIIFSMLCVDGYAFGSLFRKRETTSEYREEGPRQPSRWSRMKSSMGRKYRRVRGKQTLQDHEYEREKLQRKQEELSRKRDDVERRHGTRDHKEANCGDALVEQKQELKREYEELKAHQKELLKEVLEALKDSGHPCAKKYWNDVVRPHTYIMGREAAVHFLEGVLQQVKGRGKGGLAYQHHPRESEKGEYR